MSEECMAYCASLLFKDCTKDELEYFASFLTETETPLFLEIFWREYGKIMRT